MLTQEQNDRLTRVGPGTPAGELLRRYWLPVAVAAELTEENPVQFVRILGENLVLFRDTTGRVGLIDDRCAHRGVSLSYGRVESAASPAPTTAGSTTWTATAWRPRPSPAKASSA